MDIFQDKYIPQTVSVTALDHTYARNNFEDDIKNCAEFVNDNGGFMVTMCYFRGEINDKPLIGMVNQSDEGQVDAGKMNYLTCCQGNFSCHTTSCFCF